MQFHVNPGFFSTFSSKLSRPKTPKISKLSQNFPQNSQIFAKTRTFLFETQFSGTNIEFLKHKRRKTDLTQPNFKTQPKISPKLSFPAILVAVHAAQSLKKKPVLIKIILLYLLSFSIRDCLEKVLVSL